MVFIRNPFIRNLKEDSINLLATKEKETGIKLIGMILTKFNKPDLEKFKEYCNIIIKENGIKIALLEEARRKAETSTAFTKKDARKYIKSLRKHESEQMKALGHLKGIAKYKL